MSANDQWRWTDDEGVQRLLSGDELRKALRDGRLKSSVLVWRRGMPKWIPATEVAELADGAKAKTSTSIGKLNLVKASAERVEQSRRLRAARGAAPDGGWSDGAARRGGREDTVTNIRPGEAEAAKGNTAAAQPARKPNPWTRTLPKARKAVRPDGGDARSTNTEVLSDALQPIGLRPPSDAATGNKPKGASSQPPPPPKRSQPPPPKKRGYLPSASPIRPRSKPPSMPPPSRRPPDARATRKRAEAERGRPQPQTQQPLRALTAGSAQISSQPPRDERVPDAVAQTAASAAAAHPKSGSAHSPQTGSSAGNAAVENATARSGVTRSDPAASLETFSAEIPKAPRLPNVNASIPSDASDGVVQSRVPTEVPPPMWERAGITLPPTILMAAALGLLLLLGLAFAGGRASATARGGIADAMRARNGWVALPLYTRQQVANGTPRACLMARAPARIARPAYQLVPVELMALDETRVAIGFAASKERARGVVYDLMSAEAKDVYTPEEGDAALSRVVPLKSPSEDSGVTFATSLKEEDGLRDAVVVPARSPYTLAFQQNALVYRASDTAKPKSVWSMDTSNKPADSIRAALAGEGVAVTFRNGRELYTGEVDEQGASRVEATKVWTTTGTLGRPSVGYNGSQVAVTFAALPKGAKGAKLMLTHGTAGEALPQASEVELPAGGPGVSAIAPAIAGLSGGRWLLMWTEGPRRSRTLRAQTYDRSFRPVGSALRVSPATGSFGQGTVSVVEERVIVGFLLATGGAFELWSTVLQCQ